jgi:chromosome segregation ATPase
MAIENVTQKLQGMQIQGQGIDLQSSDLQAAKTTAPILGGESLKVTSAAMSDLEKLVARLKSESENTRQSVAQRRMSILQTVLDSMADKITEVEKENLLKIEELDNEKAEAEAARARQVVSKDATERAISMIDLQIASLEAQIRQGVEDGEKHREQVAKLKAQRVEMQAKLDTINESIKGLSAKIAGLDVKIAECTKAIASTTLSEVAAALRAAGADMSKTVEKPESQADRDREKELELQNDISRIIRESLDKIDAQILAVLDEAQMKVEG